MDSGNEKDEFYNFSYIVSNCKEFRTSGFQKNKKKSYFYKKHEKLYQIHFYKQMFNILNCKEL